MYEKGPIILNSM